MPLLNEKKELKNLQLLLLSIGNGTELICLHLLVILIKFYFNLNKSLQVS